MPFCERCSKNVPSYKMDEHRKVSGKHWFCYEHAIDFTSWAQLQAHYTQDREHFYCKPCNVHFEQSKYLKIHLDTAHFFCRDHRELFKDWDALKAHYSRSADHFFCQYCSEHFKCKEDLLFHGESYHFVCTFCVKLFADSDAHDRHNSQVHARQHCKDCNHVFETSSTLEGHRNVCGAATSLPGSSSVGPSVTVQECSDSCIPVLRKEDSDEDEDSEDDEDDYGYDDAPDEHGAFKVTKLEIPSAPAIESGDTIRRVNARRSWLSLLPLSPASLSSLSLSSSARSRTPISPTTPSSPLARTISEAPPETSPKKGKKGFKFVASLSSRVRSIASLH
ncbi:hypothetical protein SCHPADRAFT_992367 [Schizopora paradoxa]|uniref:C2H2-type domain-containing protein n=1 Tax=Schizopora paradoxa TaxID=27342 RepID=A0A0H2S7Q3_9AGAM|nr:hypothetical protein SCHPADRAFT_992367 [Schizopora paradoxa]